MQELTPQAINVVVQAPNDPAYDMWLPLLSVAIGAIIASYFSYLFNRKIMKMKMELELLDKAYKTIYQLRESANQLYTYNPKIDLQEWPMSLQEKYKEIALKYSEGVFSFKELFYMQRNLDFFQIDNTNLREDLPSDLMIIEMQATAMKPTS